MQVGSKNAAFYMGRSIKVATKSAESQYVHELGIAAERLEQRYKGGEVIICPRQYYQHLLRAKTTFGMLMINRCSSVQSPPEMRETLPLPYPFPCTKGKGQAGRTNAWSEQSCMLQAALQQIAQLIENLEGLGK